MRKSKFERFFFSPASSLALCADGSPDQRRQALQNRILESFVTEFYRVAELAKHYDQPLPKSAEGLMLATCIARDSIPNFSPVDPPKRGKNSFDRFSLYMEVIATMHAHSIRAEHAIKWIEKTRDRMPGDIRRSVGSTKPIFYDVKQKVKADRMLSAFIEAFSRRLSKSDRTEAYEIKDAYAAIAKAFFFNR